MRKKQPPNHWIILGIVSLMLITASYFVFEMTQTTSQELVTQSTLSTETVVESADQTSLQDESEPESIEYNEETLTTLLNEVNPKESSGFQIVQNATNELLQTQDFKDIQSHILQALSANSMDITVEGSSFLPKFPAQYTSAANGTKQLNIPLIIQTSPKWGSLPYGNTGSKQLYENGCAIVTLAMTQSYLDNRNVTPKDVLDWSGDRYYTPDGTSWQIFEDFTIQYGYQLENFGNNFQSAMEASNEGKLIIASVGEGFFTEVGHFVIIRGYDSVEGLVYLNDANDNPEKAHSLQGIDESILINEGLNYWAITR